MRNTRRYDKEFRINALKHLKSSDKGLKEIAAGLGIPVSTLSGWAKEYEQHGEESFFHTLKTEHVYQHRYSTREEAKRSLFEYVEVFYNRQRAHSFLGYLSPEEFEKNWSKQAI